MNKEKYFFIAICILSILTIVNYSTVGNSAILSKNYSPSTQEEVKNTINNVNFFDIEWNSTKNPFYSTNDRKDLPPSTLDLPFIEDHLSIFLPPWPAPKKESWHTFSIQSGLSVSDILTVAICPLEESQAQDSTEKKEIEKLRSQVREYDELILNNGQRYKGNIIKKDDSKVYIQVINSKGITKKSQEFENHLIKNINHKITLKEVCKQQDKLYSTTKDRLQLAQYCIKLDFLDLAESILKDLANQENTREEATIALSELYQKNCEIEKAYVLLNKKKEKNNVITYYYAKLLHKLGISIFPLLNNTNYFDSAILGLHVALEQEDTEKIKHFLEIARKLALKSKNPNILDEYEAWNALYNGDSEECLSFCNRITQKNMQVLLFEGIAYYLKGDLKKAIAPLNEAICQGEIRAVYNLALIYIKCGFFKNAKELLEKNMNHPKLIEDASLYKALFAYCNSFINKENTKSNLDLFQTAQRINPKNILVNYYLGEMLYQNTKNIDDIEKNFLTVLHSYPFPQIMWRLACLSIKMQNGANASQYISELLQYNWTEKELADLYSLNATLYLLQNNLEEAQLNLQEAMNADSSHLLCHQLFLYLENKNNQIDEALETAKIILKKFPNDSYTKQTQEAIQANKNLSGWHDNFQRSNNSIRNGWEQIERDGLVISLYNGKVLFTGSMYGSRRPGALLRSVSDKKFYSVQGECDFIEANNSIAGLFFGDWKSNGLFFGKNEQGEFVYCISDKEGNYNWKIINTPIQSSESGIMKIQRTNAKSNLYSLFWNNTKVTEIKMSLAQSMKLQAGFFAVSFDSSWKFFIDNSYIIEKK